MPARRRTRTAPDASAAPSRGPGTARSGDLGLRCARLERLVRRLAESRAAARAELAAARDRLRTVGDDFVTAFEAIDARTDAAVAAAELRGVLCGDLDMESMLTVATEHLLARFRPANSAIWLCNGRGDHALAAYGANDVRRAEAEASLGILARETCPLLGTEAVATEFERALDAVTVPPPGGGVLAGRRAIMAPMVHRGERYGALMVFQDEDSAWPPNAAQTLASIAALLGEHIDRISRIVVRRAGEWPGTDSD